MNDNKQIIDRKQNNNNNNNNKTHIRNTKVNINQNK